MTDSYYITPKYISNTFLAANLQQSAKDAVDTAMQSVDINLVVEIMTGMDHGLLAVRAANQVVADAAKLNDDYGAAIRKMIATNRSMELVHRNAFLAEMATAISKLEYTQLQTGKNLYPGGHYPLPTVLPDLELWLSGVSTKNIIHVGADNNPRCVGLVDYREKRTFEAIAREAAPLYVNSRDKGSSELGIEQLQVLDITPTTSVFRLTDGPPLVLQKDFTIFRIIRTGPAGTKFKMFGDNRNVNSVYFNTPTNNCVSAMNGSVNVIQTVPGSTTANKASVACVAVSDNFKWSANGISDSLPVNGTGVAAYNPPQSVVSFDSLFGGGSTGEFAEVLVYNRLLSIAEIHALTDYFSLIYTNNQALQLVLTALEQQ